MGTLSINDPNSEVHLWNFSEMNIFSNEVGIFVRIIFPRGAIVLGATVWGNRFWILWADHRFLFQGGPQCGGLQSRATDCRSVDANPMLFFQGGVKSGAYSLRGYSGGGYNLGQSILNLVTQTPVIPTTLPDGGLALQSNTRPHPLPPPSFLPPPLQMNRSTIINQSSINHPPHPNHYQFI